MSHYRGPRFKKIRRLGALPGLTNKRPRAGSDLRNQSRFEKKSQYRIRLEEKQKLHFQR
ncbi:30S ribosomal protein S4 [Helianthus anomalus]